MKSDRLYQFFVTDDKARWKAMIRSISVGAAVGFISSMYMSENYSIILCTVTAIAVFEWHIHRYVRKP